ncbi:MAG: hypothetical protein IH813_07335 [Thaumarchaeota archaeon]|nr:hypothetical protein [Nitrososphaerota archaeon]
MKKLGFMILLFSLYSVMFTITANAESFVVSTNKQIYLDGEFVKISGTVSKYGTYPVSIEIINPIGASINTIAVIPNHNSEFFIIIETGGEIWKHDGEYNLVITHASFPNSERISFEYLHSIPEPIPNNAGHLGEEHVKAKLIVKVYDDKFDFLQPQFQMQSHWIRFEDGETIHRYASGVTLGFLFDTLGLSGQNNECYVFQGGSEYCTNAYFNFKFLINEFEVSKTDFREYVIQDDDEILIIYDDQITTQTLEIKIPDWVREVAGFWCGDEIDDASFVSAIQYLIETEIIIIPKTTTDESASQIVPSWVKTNACWWSTNQISDNEFASGLEYLIKNGIITI